MPSFEVNIVSKDDPRGIQSATNETQKYTDAVGKALEADRKRTENKEARATVAAMSEAEKQATLSAYQLASAQEQANTKIGQTGPAAGNAAGTVMNIKNAWMEAAAAIQVAETVIRAGQEAYSQTLGKLIAYGTQIRDLTQLTGTNAEASSRLYQVADDLEVKYEDLSKTMEFAAKHGIVPTIENIATLSDKYRSLETQTEKNTFVFQNFGKSGMDVVNVLEQGSEKLLAMNNAVSSALILNDQQLLQIKQLIASQDEYNDQLDMEKLKIGGDLLPVWQAFLDMQVAYRDVKEKEKIGAERMIPIYGQIANAVTLVKSAMGAHELQTKRVADAAKSAADAVNQEKNAINGLQNKKVTLETEIKMTGNYNKDYMAAFLASHPGFTPGAYRARGGPVKKGGVYWTGEEGPEPFIPESDGYIVSNKDAMSGLGEVSVQVALNYAPMISLANQASAAYELANLIDVELRRRGYKK